MNFHNDTISITNEDNMQLMARYPDKYFELAIVDPPYGINADENAYKNGINCRQNGFKEYKKGQWDKSPPQKKIFFVNCLGLVKIVSFGGQIIFRNFFFRLWVG